MNDFKNLNLHFQLLENLEKQKINQPTDLQNEYIRAFFNHPHDAVIHARTGTGKTLAFLLPLLSELLIKNQNLQPHSLIVVPTRELAIQISHVIDSLIESTTLNCVSLYGGHRTEKQLSKLKQGADLIVATPGRLMDCVQNHQLKLHSLNTLVIDEADQMLLLGFQKEMQWLDTQIGKNTRRIASSATFDAKVKKLIYRFFNNPEIYEERELKTEKLFIDELKIGVSDRWKFNAFMTHIVPLNPFMAIVFCRTIRRVEKIEGLMRNEQLNCKILHGDIKQNHRERIMKDFRSGKIQYLICTDVASRGLDIEGITHVIHYDAPESQEDYVHRTGRVGRMGKEGKVISFVPPGEGDIEYKNN